MLGLASVEVRVRFRVRVLVRIRARVRRIRVLGLGKICYRFLGLVDDFFHCFFAYHFSSHIFFIHRILSLTTFFLAV